MHEPLTTEALHAAALTAAMPLAHAAREEGGGPLQVEIADGRIASARFRATGDALGDAWLELYCRAIEGLPVEEAAAHGASYARHRLVPAGHLAGAGIAPATAAHPALAAAQAALRAQRAQWRSDTGPAVIERADYLALPAEWLALDATARLAALRAALAAAVGDGTLADAGLAIAGLEDDIRGRPVRVTVTHPPGADDAALPVHLRRLEGVLRARVAPWLEIYAEERQDHNKLRRAIVIEPRKPER